MTNREARKAALRLAADRTRAPICFEDLNTEQAITDDDLKRISSAAAHIADHLEWEADGRPERT